MPRGWRRTATAPASRCLPVFTAPPLPDGVVPVNTGALNRIFALVALIKDSAGATEPIQSDLRITGPEDAGPDLETLQPIITLTRLAASILVGWGWQGFSAFLHMLEIQVDRGDGKGWVILDFDTTPDYTDTAPFPATLTKWKYRAIYRLDDAQVGLWSDVREIVVGG